MAVLGVFLTGRSVPELVCISTSPQQLSNTMKTLCRQAHSKGAKQPQHAVALFDCRCIRRLPGQILCAMLLQQAVCFVQAVMSPDAPPYTVRGSANCTRALLGALQRDGKNIEALSWLQITPKIAELESRLDRCAAAPHTGASIDDIHPHATLHRLTLHRCALVDSGLGCPCSAS